MEIKKFVFNKELVKIIDAKDDEINECQNHIKSILIDCIIKKKEHSISKISYTNSIESIRKYLNNLNIKEHYIEQMIYLIYDKYSFLDMFQFVIKYGLFNKKNKSNFMTYILYSKSIGYKIGKSENVERRLNQIICYNPNAALFAICNKDIESFLHKKYEHKKIYSEWFNLNNEDLKAIIKLGFEIL